MSCICEVTASDVYKNWMRREVLSEKKGSPFHSGYTWEGRVHIDGNKVKISTVENCFGKYSINQFPKIYLPKAQSFEINWKKRTMKYGLNHEDVFNKDRGLHYQTGYIHINRRYRYEFLLQWKGIKIILKDGNKG